VIARHGGKPEMVLSRQPHAIGVRWLAARATLLGSIFFLNCNLVAHSRLDCLFSIRDNPTKDNPNVD
jgi:hypothetical protein